MHNKHSETNLLDDIHAIKHFYPLIATLLKSSAFILFTHAVISFLFELVGKKESSYTPEYTDLHHIGT